MKSSPLHILAWCVAAAVASPQGLDGQVSADPTQNVMAGSRVFGAKGCGRCHAINGLGGEVGPDLALTSQARSYFDFAAAMWNHLPSMVEEMRRMGIERPRLGAREAGDLVAFLFWLNYFDPAGSPERGAVLFREKQCIACHQVEGAGGVGGPSLDFLHRSGSPIEVATTLWNHGPRMTEAMRARGIRRPSFTSEELVDLIAYLRDASPAVPEGPVYVLPGRAEEGRRGFAELGCIACHRQPGRGGEAGPDLGARGRPWSLLQFAAAMWNKAPAMASMMASRGGSVPQMEPGEMADIVAYLSSVQYFGESGRAARGPQRIRAKGCLDCHTLDGAAGAGGAGNLARTAGLDSPAAVVAAMWNHTLIGAAEDDPRRVWPMFTAGEMADLAAFLQASPAAGSGAAAIEAKRTAGTEGVARRTR